ncbi:hypothetical protein ACLMJK_003486 [Lecanora helva]
MALIYCAVWALSLGLAVPQSTYEDALSATGLLGDHFGVPGSARYYDYVIVGGGTAGNTLAARLATNASITVALIEAGGFYETDNGNMTQIPAGVVVKNPLIDWYQYTTPQEGFGGRSVPYSSGKTLGGGSARNFLWYMRSCVGAYQKWANQVGDSSYTFTQLDPYFRKSVQFNPPAASERPSNASILTDPKAFSYSGGPLQVSYPAWMNGISSWVEEALSKLGLRQVPGFLDGNILGYSYIAQTSTSDQVRSSSESSFLQEALEKTTNLQIYKSSTATKIIFDSNKRASGLEVNTAGLIYQIKANKEIIISTGTDHVVLGPAYAVDLETHSQLTANPAFLADAVIKYNTRRQGILTNPGADFVAFEKLPSDTISNSTRHDLESTFGPDWPDIELVPFDNNLVSLPTDGRNYVSGLVGLVAPFSRGNVTINSTSTLDNPIVSPNWLTDPRDLEVAIAGFKRSRQIFSQPSMKNIIAGDMEYSPGVNVTSDSAILQVIRQTASAISHAAGTCRMGVEADEAAVVDSKGRVFGVNGLRVVDASAFPILPPGHPQGTVCK